MNKDQLKKNVGQQLRLRPHPLVVKIEFPRIPVVLTSEFPRPKQRLVKTDYKWSLVAVTDDGVTLHCLHTDHKITLGADNVREYRTPDFLMLKCQLILNRDKVHIERI